MRTRLTGVARAFGCAGLSLVSTVVNLRVLCKTWNLLTKRLDVSQEVCTVQTAYCGTSNDLYNSPCKSTLHLYCYLTLGFYMYHSPTSKAFVSPSNPQNAVSYISKYKTGSLRTLFPWWYLFIRLFHSKPLHVSAVLWISHHQVVIKLKNLYTDLF
jgi:hypothetical protein